MPIEYPGGGVLAEHEAVRDRVGLFDVSHLGKVAVRGGSGGGAAFVDACLTNALGRIGPGRAQYSLCCDDAGRRRRRPARLPARGRRRAARPERREHRRGRAAAGGPRPTGVDGDRRARPLRRARRPGPARGRRPRRPRPAGRAAYMSFADAQWEGAPVTVCRTGYTGERGYELLPAGRARAAALGRAARARSAASAACRAGSAPATRCAPRWVTRCTGTSCRSRSARCRPAPAGRWAGPSRRSGAATPSSPSGSAGPSACCGACSRSSAACRGRSCRS